MGKAVEKIRNWSAYNKALAKPRPLNIWIEQETLAGWYAKRTYGKNGRPTDIVIDSTGMKVYGEGESKCQKHGIGKRSVWLTAHLAVDPATNLIVVAGISSLKNGGDGQIGEKMIRKLPKIVKRVFGDVALRFPYFL